jgi:hypothetical protein
VPVGLALLKVDRMLLHMHDPWNLIIKKRKLVNAALMELNRLDKIQPKPENYAHLVNELKGRVHILIIKLTRRANKLVNHTLMSFTLDRAAEFFNNNMTMFSDLRQTAVLRLTRQINPSYTKSLNNDTVTGAKILSNSKIKPKDIILADSNPDSSHNKVLQTGMDTMDEYYHSNDHLRVKKVIENGKTWHENLIGYKEKIPTDDLLTNNGESEPSLEGEPNLPRELNLEDSESEQDEREDLTERSLMTDGS